MKAYIFLQRKWNKTFIYKPQQNEIAKRRNITLIDITRSMMTYAGLKLYPLQHIFLT
jgi:hypothetical protein